MTEWYFAYASNLWLDQMIARLGAMDFSTHAPKVAHLVRHRIAFNMYDGNDRFYANLLTTGDGVYGVLYPCTSEALQKLDAFEIGYERRAVSVVTESDEEIEATAYFAKATSTRDGGRPTEEYLDRILSGARQHRLPEAYIRQMKLVAGPKPAEARTGAVSETNGLTPLRPVN